jgi:hypothetical protein
MSNWRNIPITLRTPEAKGTGLELGSKKAFLSGGPNQGKPALAAQWINGAGEHTLS